MADQPIQEKPSRMFFIDNLRIYLTILVILHHLSVIYAANTNFYYLEPTKSIVSIVVLVFFQLFNQAYFMGLFFFLSGYFSPGSYDRKGPLIFLKDRLLRLGIPIIIYYYLLGPIASIGFFQMPSSITGNTSPFFWRVGIGPLWFVAMLLIFDLSYLLWRKIKQNQPVKLEQVSAPAPKFRTILLFILALTVASYLIRIIAPIGKYFVFFPSLAYLPQYISFFILGTMACQRDWICSIPSKYGKNGFIAVLMSILLFLVAISPKFGSSIAYIGGGTIQSGLYALWDSIFSVGLCLALIVFFRRFFDHQKGFGRSLQRSSFTVYIIHCPIITLLAAFLLSGIQIASMLKFCLAACISVPICFIAAYIIRKIPLINKIM